MQKQNRHYWNLAHWAFAVAVISWSGIASADAYPVKPIRIIVPLPPGTASDFIARVLGQSLTDTYKQQVVTDNRPGAGGLIGSNLVTKASPDGYTLGMVGAPHLVGPLLQSNPPYRPLDDIVAIVEVAAVPNVLLVAPGVPVKSVQQLVALAKSKPGELNFASVGVGSISHLGAEIFNRAAGITAVHIPFKVISDAYGEMLAQRVHYMIFTVPAAVPMLRDGKLRALAVTTERRSLALPDVPTIVEAGLPEAQSYLWLGVIGPAGVPRSIAKKLHGDIIKILREPQIREQFERQGAEPIVDASPEAFMHLLKSEYKRYDQLLGNMKLQAQ